MNWINEFERNEDYNQIVTWRGTTMKPEQNKEFCEWFVQSELGQNYPKVIGNVKDMDGLYHLLFFVHSADISKFAVRRFRFNGEMSWYEDAISNGTRYPTSLLLQYPKDW